VANTSVPLLLLVRVPAGTPNVLTEACIGFVSSFTAITGVVRPNKP
jgi:hypothetical protein